MSEPATLRSTPADTLVVEVMTGGVVVLPADATVGTCAVTMVERHTHAVLIVDGASQTPVGWVDHQRILRHLGSDPLTTLARDAITQAPATIEPEATLQQAAERMVDEALVHLLVTRAPAVMPLGVLSGWDVMAFYADAYGHES